MTLLQVSLTLSVIVWSKWGATKGVPGCRELSKRDRLREFEGHHEEVEVRVAYTYVWVTPHQMAQFLKFLHPKIAPNSAHLFVINILCFPLFP